MGRKADEAAAANWNEHIENAKQKEQETADSLYIQTIKMLSDRIDALEERIKTIEMGNEA